MQPFRFLPIGMSFIQSLSRLGNPARQVTGSLDVWTNSVESRVNNQWLVMLDAIQDALRSHQPNSYTSMIHELYITSPIFYTAKTTQTPA